MGFDTIKWLGFPCLTSIPLILRVWQFFLTSGLYYTLVEDDEKAESVERVLCWIVSRKGIEF